jgi:hypothetical protein
MESELVTKRSECINVLHTVGIKLKYFATEKDAQFLRVYKRILHIINGLLRLDDLNFEQYHTIYLWFKDESYRTPWDQDLLSNELLNIICINLPHLLSNNNDNVEEIRKCAEEEITNTINEEIDMLLELN